MRAGLFLEGLSRSHSVRVLVVPVVSGAPPEPGFIAEHAESMDALTLEAEPDAAAVIRARLSTREGRERAATLHPLPGLCRRLTPAASAAVARAAGDAGAVHVLRTYLAPLLDDLLDSPRPPPLVLDVDDFESRTRRQLGDSDEAERYARLEAHYLPRMDHVLATAAGDAEDLRRRHRLSAVTAVPNAVRAPARLHTETTRHDLLFVGNLSYAPNADAARWLCERVLPLLPGVRTGLIGSAPPAEVKALASERVDVIPDVPDVAPFYAGARVAVAPISAGGGSRTKILEALAHGRPVVSTAAGMEGLDLAGGDSGVLRADGPEAFAAACRGLLDDPARARELGARGRELVLASAGTEQVAGRIDELFTRISSR